MRRLRQDGALKTPQHRSWRSLEIVEPEYALRSRNQLVAEIKRLTEERDELPAKAFGLPKQRKYPMYRMVSGKPVPSSTHASDAKGRAQAQYNKRKLSKADQEFVKSQVATVLPNGVKIIEGMVVSIADGDTLTVLDDTKSQFKIRLQGIDTPESRQAFGTQARKALASKVFKKNVRIEWEEKDRYGRTLGDVYLGDRWINKELLEEGWAWHYKQYSDSEELAQAETAARNTRAGLWKDNHPVPPWEYRHNPSKRKPQEPESRISQQQPTTSPPAATNTHWITNSSGVRHNSSCRYYENSKGRKCGPDAGRACKICGG